MSDKRKTRGTQGETTQKAPDSVKAPDTTVGGTDGKDVEAKAPAGQEIRDETAKPQPPDAAVSKTANADVTDTAAEGADTEADAGNVTASAASQERTSTGTHEEGTPAAAGEGQTTTTEDGKTEDAADAPDDGDNANAKAVGDAVNSRPPEPIRPTGTREGRPGSFRRGLAIGIAALALLAVTLGPSGYAIITGGGSQGGNSANISNGNENENAAGNEGNGAANGTDLTTDPAALQGRFLMRLDQSYTYRGETWPSSNRDEGAVSVSGSGTTVNILDGTLTKSGGDTSSEEVSTRYGLNAAMLATAGGSVTTNGTHITTSADGSAGAFVYGNGSAATVTEGSVSTSETASPALVASDAGHLTAENLAVSTMGSKSPAVSAIGGGTVDVSGGSYSTSGQDSPAISTEAVVNASGTRLAATASTAISVTSGGKASVSDSNVSGNASALEKDVRANVLMAWDGEAEGEENAASLSINGGSLISNGGDMLRVSGTNATISLTGVRMQTVDDKAPLLTVIAGKAKAASATVTASHQELEGNVSVDAKSSLGLTLSDGSTLTGTIEADKVSKDDAANGRTVKVTVEAGSTWKLTGDCTIGELDNRGTIDFNGYKITLADGTVLK